ncbi:methyltransferase domain-containing protein [Myxococcota bacterium]|nr:methyltransferase domain-containing protein [Myxococcota bacterium]
MNHVSLAESGLGVGSEEVLTLFEPFAERRFAPTDPDWIRELARRERKIRRRYWRRRLLGRLSAGQRSHDVVRAEYSKAWAGIDFAEYDPARGVAPRPSPWQWRDRCWFASDVGATRVRQLLLIRLLEKLSPRHVLEVGCGNGVNLMLLAGRFPEISFTGVELTREGVRAATELQRLGELPKPMQAFAPLPLRDVGAFRRVRFVQGNAARLPFADAGVDLVVTILALEQMERVRSEALAEIARVARHHTLMIEPFRELNERGPTRRYIVARDYFQGRIADLPRYGLDPQWVLDDFPQESYLHAGLVLSARRPARR